VRQQDPDTGDIRTVWSNLHVDVPAAIEPLSAKDYFAAKAVQSEATVRIVVRYKPDLAATQRILHGSKIYNPTQPLPDRDSGREYVTIICSEGVNEGA
jgi:SPP1 family predicted phage head-tail adaptor